MKQGMGVGIVVVSFLAALGVAACGDEGGEPGPGTAACCTGTQCTVVSSSACSQMDGIYKASESSCGTNTCSPVGACFDGSNCTMTSMAECMPPKEWGPGMCPG